MSSKSMTENDLSTVVSTVLSEVPESYDINVANDQTQLRVMVSKQNHTDRFEKAKSYIQSACDKTNLSLTLDAMETSDEYIFVISK